MANTGFNRNYLYNVYNRKQPETEGKTCIAGGTVYLDFFKIILQLIIARVFIV